MYFFLMNCLDNYKTEYFVWKIQNAGSLVFCISRVQEYTCYLYMTDIIVKGRSKNKLVFQKKRKGMNPE